MTGRDVVENHHFPSQKKPKESFDSVHDGSSTNRYKTHKLQMNLRPQVSRTPQRVRLQRPVGPVLLPLVRTGPGEMAGPGQVEDRPAREKSVGPEHDLSGRVHRQTLDVQQRRGHCAVSRE